MNIRRCTVIGVYPPPYGGATVKCKLLDETLKNNDIQITSIDAYADTKNIKQILSVVLNCIRAFRSNEPIIYCLDSKRLRAIMSIQSLFRSSFENTTIVVIGGVFQNTIKKHPVFIKWLRKIKAIWVETEGMKKELIKMGFYSVEVFPNAKTESGCCKPQKSVSGTPLRLVFFSTISSDKGVEDIISLVQLLDADKSIEYSLDFYGHVVPEFKGRFDSFIQQSIYVNYCGVFNAVQNNVYKKLNEYDFLLFPTHWNTEGVPGILVEAKMAGLAVIASDRSYNQEIIRPDQQEGFLLKKDYAREMYDIILQCYRERRILNDCKRGSYQSRKRYSLEMYSYMCENI